MSFTITTLLGFPRNYRRLLLTPSLDPSVSSQVSCGTISGETGLRTVSDHTIDFGVRARQSTDTTKGGHTWVAIPLSDKQFLSLSIPPLKKWTDASGQHRFISNPEEHQLSLTGYICFELWPIRGPTNLLGKSSPWLMCRRLLSLTSAALHQCHPLIPDGPSPCRGLRRLANQQQRFVEVDAALHVEVGSLWSLWDNIDKKATRGVGFFFQLCESSAPVWEISQAKYSLRAVWQGDGHYSSSLRGSVSSLGCRIIPIIGLVPAFLHSDTLSPCF